jgi:hypothetical protein
MPAIRLLHAREIRYSHDPNATASKDAMSTRIDGR